MKRTSTEPSDVLNPSKGRSIRILIADDHTMVRQGLSQICEAEPDMQVIGQAADGRQAVLLARSLNFEEIDNRLGGLIMKKRNIPFVVLTVVSYVVILIACGRSQAQERVAVQPVAQVEQPGESAPSVDVPEVKDEHEEVEAAHGAMEAEHQEQEAEHEATEAMHEETEAEHQETAAHVHSPEDHMAGNHGVPEEAAAVPNPRDRTACPRPGSHAPPAGCFLPRDPSLE